MIAVTSILELPITMRTLRSGAAMPVVMAQASAGLQENLHGFRVTRPFNLDQAAKPTWLV
jgi:hypothetical protein